MSTRGRLELIYGSMFGGKTTELIARILRHNGRITLADLAIVLIGFGESCGFEDLALVLVQLGQRCPLGQW